MYFVRLSLARKAGHTCAAELGRSVVTSYERMWRCVRAFGMDRAEGEFVRVGFVGVIKWVWCSRV